MTTYNKTIKRLQFGYSRMDYQKKIHFENSWFHMSYPSAPDQLTCQFSGQFTLYCAVFLATVSSNLEKLILALKMQSQFEFNSSICNNMRNNMRFTHAFIAQNANMVSKYLRKHPEQALFIDVYDPGICFPQAYFIKGLSKLQRLQVIWWNYHYDQYMSARCANWVSTRSKAIWYFKENKCDLDFSFDEYKTCYHFLGRYKFINFAKLRNLVKPGIDHVEQDQSCFIAPLFEEFSESSEFYTDDELMTFTTECPDWSNPAKLLKCDFIDSTEVITPNKEYQYLDCQNLPNSSFHCYYGCFRYSIKPNENRIVSEAHEQVHDEIETISVDICWLIQDFFDEFNSTYEYDFITHRIEVDWDEVIKYCPEVFRITPKIKLIEERFSDLFRTFQTYNTLGKYKLLKKTETKVVLLQEESISKYICSKITRFFNRLEALKSDSAEKPNVVEVKCKKVVIPTITESEAVDNYMKSRRKTPKQGKTMKVDPPLDIKTSAETPSLPKLLEEPETKPRGMSFLEASKSSKVSLNQAKAQPRSPQYIETPSGLKIRRRLTYHAENLVGLLINIAQNQDLINYGLIRSVTMAYLIHDCIRTRRPITDTQKLNIKKSIAFYMSSQFTVNFKVQTFQKALDGLVDTFNHMSSEEIACCKRNLLECVSYLFEKHQGYPILHVFPTFFRLKGTDCPESSYKG